jgi:NADP-dependent 3-hydroxy acid dehydrogenase YdfG
MGSSSSTPSGYNSSTEAATVAKDLQVHCVNKNVIVTGANCGLGFETARVLSQNGAEVILCSRNLKNGEDAVLKIKGKCYPDIFCTFQ